ncbi:DUF485 domain-containing protein [Streptomyces sp. G-G2]|uniref:DUF485 domain-containing protein n=1 Tax=Streptomyces sp. G-G2 TaxID=3046201 RepID=UPI0024BBD92D|nr:DUF485 domain-containing protein [Streptomyces sp. G-G2]MDJ0381267.1 DUF485 domain-containing protein [Streptomyces sp. G-G2]
MTTETAPPPDGPGAVGPDHHPGPTVAAFVQEQQSAEFAALRRSHRSFAFPLTIGFVAWYLLFVFLSNYAGGFMGTKLFGNVNVALVLGLAQFASTFLIAWLYSRHASAKLDPKAEAIKSRMEAEA